MDRALRLAGGKQSEMGQDKKALIFIPRTRRREVMRLSL